jgi:hypothetical protein
MVTQAPVAVVLGLLVPAVGLSVLSAACDKMPLLAPSGTVITLFASSTVLPVNGSIEITATAIEQGAAPSAGTGTGGTTGTTSTPGQGTPVHNGTLITFTTTLGRIQPTEARTHNGQVTVKLFADSQSGMAKVIAFSGGARSAELQIKVGSAASKTVIMAASPATLPSTGGTADIAARVEDENGSSLPGAPVTFSTTQGTIAPTTATTDSGGIAHATLTTNAKAEVTATSGTATAKITVDLRPRVGVTITGPATAPAAGLPANFTVSVAAGANVTNVTVDFGDGTRQSLGALSGSTTVSHTYTNPGTYSATATATEATGDVTTVATAITILPAQPPGVTILASNSAPTCNALVTVTANVTGAISTIQSFVWNFEAVAIPAMVTTTGNQTQVRWTSNGTKVITVTVNQATGPSGNGLTSVQVSGCI